MIGHVFVSYSHRDSAYVDALVAFLRRSGMPVWTDGGLDLGDEWETRVFAEIDECAVFVPIMSPDAAASPWVERELDRAQAGGKLVCPLLLRGPRFPWLDDVDVVDVADGSMPDVGFVECLRGALSPRG